MISSRENKMPITKSEYLKWVYSMFEINPLMQAIVIDSNHTRRWFLEAPALHMITDTWIAYPTPGTCNYGYPLGNITIDFDWRESLVLRRSNTYEKLSNDLRILQNCIGNRYYDDAKLRIDQFISDFQDFAADQKRSSPMKIDSVCSCVDIFLVDCDKLETGEYRHRTCGRIVCSAVRDYFNKFIEEHK